MEWDGMLDGGWRMEDDGFMKRGGWIDFVGVEFCGWGWGWGWEMGDEGRVDGDWKEGIKSGLGGEYRDEMSIGMGMGIEARSAWSEKVIGVLWV